METLMYFISGRDVIWGAGEKYFVENFVSLDLWSKCSHTCTPLLARGGANTETRHVDTLPAKEISDSTIGIF